MDYELYHGESLEGGNWHGMLLVPVPSKPEFSEFLLRARGNIRYSDKNTLSVWKGYQLNQTLLLILK